MSLFDLLTNSSKHLVGSNNYVIGQWFKAEFDPVDGNIKMSRFRFGLGKIRCTQYTQILL